MCMCVRVYMSVCMRSCGGMGRHSDRLLLSLFFLINAN